MSLWWLKWSPQLSAGSGACSRYSLFCRKFFKWILVYKPNRSYAVCDRFTTVLVRWCLMAVFSACLMSYDSWRYTAFVSWQSSSAQICWQGQGKPQSLPPCDLPGTAVRFSDPAVDGQLGGPGSRGQGTRCQSCQCPAIQISTLLCSLSSSLSSHQTAPRQVRDSHNINASQGY